MLMWIMHALPSTWNTLYCLAYMVYPMCTLEQISRLQNQVVWLEMYSWWASTTFAYPSPFKIFSYFDHVPLCLSQMWTLQFDSIEFQVYEPVDCTDKNFFHRFHCSWSSAGAPVNHLCHLMEWSYRFACKWSHWCPLFSIIIKSIWHSKVAIKCYWIKF